MALFQQNNSHALKILFVLCFSCVNNWAGTYQPKVMLNLGAACYANAGLQCLFATQSFIPWLTSEKLDQNLTNLCQRATTGYKEYFHLQHAIITIKSALDKKNPKIKGLTAAHKENEYSKDDEYRKKSKEYAAALKAKNETDKQLQEAVKANIGLFQLASLKQMTTEYLNNKISSINTACIAASLGNLGLQQDAAEQTLKILDNISDQRKTLPTYFLLNFLGLNALSEMYTDLFGSLELQAIDSNNIPGAIESAAKSTENLPKILIVTTLKNITIPIRIEKAGYVYNLVGTAWRVDGDRGAGHYFAIIKYNNKWFRLDEPTHYGNEYDISTPPPLQIMQIPIPTIEDIYNMHEGKKNITQKSFDIPGDDNNNVTCRMLVYERQDEAEKKKKSDVAPQALAESLQKLNQDLTTLGGLVTSK